MPIGISYMTGMALGRACARYGLVRESASGRCALESGGVSPNCRELTALTCYNRHARRTCDRANVGKTWCTRQCQRQVRTVGEKDEDDGICREKQCPFSGVVVSSYSAIQCAEKRDGEIGISWLRGQIDWDNEHLPARVPRDPEPNEVGVGKEGPKEEEAVEEISRRPRNESVEFWSSASDFSRRWCWIHS